MWSTMFPCAFASAAHFWQRLRPKPKRGYEPLGTASLGIAQGSAEVELSHSIDPQRYAKGFGKRMVESLAVPTIIHQIARTVNPMARRRDSYGDAVVNHIAGLSDNLFSTPIAMRLHHRPASR